MGKDYCTPKEKPLDFSEALSTSFGFVLIVLSFAFIVVLIDKYCSRYNDFDHRNFNDDVFTTELTGEKNEEE